GAVVVYTAETIHLPSNVFGFLSGKGSLIYHGVFVSPGKIDPCFQDQLRVGLLNASKKRLLLEQGMAICSCTFINMETHIDRNMSQYAREPIKPTRPGMGRRMSSFLFEHWKWCVTTLVAIVVAAA